MKHQLRLVLGLLLLGTVAQSAYAQGAGRDQSTGELPLVAGKGSLTVAGDGYWHRDMYQDGEHPSLSAYDNTGQLLPDGVYRYEFRSFPEGAGSSPMQQELLRAEGRGISEGRGKSRPPNTQYGSFEVQGGQLILR